MVAFINTYVEILKIRKREFGELYLDLNSQDKILSNSIQAGVLLQSERKTK